MFSFFGDVAAKVKEVTKDAKTVAKIVEAAEIKAAAKESAKSAAAEAKEAKEELDALNAYWKNWVNNPRPYAVQEVERQTREVVSWWHQYYNSKDEQQLENELVPDVDAALEALGAAGIANPADIRAVQEQIAATPTVRPKGLAGGR